MRLTTAFMLFVSLFHCVISTAEATSTLITPAPQANHITTLDSTNLGEVNVVMQSQKGYIWLGTNDGLIRFDGYSSKHFVHDDNNPHSISHNSIIDIVEDKQHNLWLGTFGGGLNKFTPATGRFEKISLATSDQTAAPSDLLYELAIDNQNTLWIGSTKGLRTLSLDTELPVPLPQPLRQLDDFVMPQVFFDQQHQMWIAGYKHGVYRYINGNLQHFSLGSKSANDPAEDIIRRIIEDKQGNIWVGAANALLRFDGESQSFQRFKPSAQSDFDEDSDDIMSILPDQHGQLLLGTINEGVLSFSPQSKQFTRISGINDVYHQFKSKRVNDIIADKDGTIWFATDEGIIVIPEKAQKFSYVSNSAANLAVTDIVQLRSGNTAIAGDFRFYQLDPQGLLGSNSQPGLLGSNTQPDSRFEDVKRLYRITQDHKGNLWFATIGHGIMFYQQSNDTLTAYNHDKDDSSSLPTNYVYDVVIDDAQRVWSLMLSNPPSFSGGVVQMQPATPTTAPTPNNNDSGRHQHQIIKTFNNAVNILPYADDQLLLTSNINGLLSLDTNSKVVTRWKKVLDNIPLYFYDVFKDSRNRLWLGTRGQGLALFDPQIPSIKFYGSAEGLLSNNIFSITEADDHALWLGTPVGLTRFDPASEQVMNIEKQDGLLFTKFYKRSAIKTAQGRLMMGTAAGLVSFDPQDFSQSNPPVTVVINDFKLFNQSVGLSSEDNPTVLKQTIEFTDQLRLSHQDYIFSFGFAALTYNRQDKIQFAYKMQGLDNNWLYTDSSNRVASYTTLPAGDYEFQVKASNALGQWNSEPTTIKITILPPWWRNPSSYVLYIVLTLVILFTLIHKRTRKLINQAKTLEHKVDERTKELQRSRDEVVQQAKTVSDLLAQKQQLFASVSHEFRTPLTLILSPVDQLLADPKGQPIKNELLLIKRSGRRLLRMVDQLLEFAKLEQQVERTMELVSLQHTLGVIVASFESLVQSKHISLMVTPFEDINLVLLRDSLNQMLINLLSNAFKYSTERSQITVTITTANHQVNIAITDTGIGIASSDHKDIFERFNRATHDHGEAIIGAGIGLALVKELAEANQGTITLVSALKQGSTFTITLPIAEPSAVAALDAQKEDAKDKPRLLQQHLDLEIDSVNQTGNAKASIDNAGDHDDGNKKTILIVDDNADMRILLHDQLSGQYRCLLAEHGRSGLTLAHEQLPDLVISDVMMPVMDGYEFTERLKSDELSSHIPVILLTAKGSMESRLKGLQLLVDDYVAKPFNIEELKLRIHNILTIRDIFAQRFSQVADAPRAQGLVQTAASEQAQLSDIKGDIKGEVEDQSEELPQTLALNAVNQRFYDKMSEQLEQHYSNSELNTSMFAEALHVTEKQLQRKLKALLGIGFTEWVRNFRLNRASDLLTQGHRASQIFDEVGFASHSYFSSCFKAKFGVTPKQFQATS
ncbi:MAG: signal transduction histidine kinase/ligand-binding sensor domain-containing protein [Phenylobacterium sp.]|jgi:signal transduction histidine kinase/ligand-binding sensor domain-containing protein/DNA-binding response OmpR family regulator